MRLRLSCRDVTRLVLEGHDRPLARGERLRLRLHWLACDACRLFRGQSRLLQQAMPRWRAYREGDDGPASGDSQA
jgi:hypothetical protein